jgi:hypothetical protein
MNMNMYWPQHKVFFMATLSLFPEKVTGRPLMQYSDFYYFGSYTEDELVQQLFKYKREGYLDFEHVPVLVANNGPDDESNFKPAPWGFMIKSINASKATDDLIEYLENWHSDKLSTDTAHKPDDHTYQYRRFMPALMRAYKRQTMPHINAVDIYGDNTTNFYNYEPPFWETILTPQLVSGHYTIRQMDYDLKNRGQPFVSIELTNQKFRRWLELSGKSSEPVSDDDPEEFEYEDLLAARDGVISYKGTRIPFTRQEADAMRVFLRRPEELRTEDDFTDPYANIFSDPSSHDDIHATLSKLISRTRKKLDKVVEPASKSCITNLSGQGWILKIHPSA